MRFESQRKKTLPGTKALLTFCQLFILGLFAFFTRYFIIIVISTDDGILFQSIHNGIFPLTSDISTIPHIGITSRSVCQLFWLHWRYVNVEIPRGSAVLESSEVIQMIWEGMEAFVINVSLSRFSILHVRHDHRLIVNEYLVRGKSGSELESVREIHSFQLIP